MKITSIRKQRGMTQTQLAERCGTTQQQIAKIEGGIVDPRLSTVFKIASALDVEVAEMFHTRREFLDAINGAIQRMELDATRMKLARLVAICAESADLPSFHPFWEEVVIEGGRVKFKEV